MRTVLLASVTSQADEQAWNEFGHKTDRGKYQRARYNRVLAGGTPRDGVGFREGSSAGRRRGSFGD